ncbi:MAG: amidase [Gammaproteobacteria bacterium CG11_big_fil_rev_8_21_14_0_20_46_22]|nr:MAG: amidase [Gammaproteobacteria bacterium CG12_big_fil_rev_8_21_14_0_65_46_12]PIR11171.1 MAG: amidase [Gammaproteobacteria bacterium CG11_big_fil_rev_8_21_14_0_20_46_22]
MTELTALSATTLATGIKNKTYSCVEVMQAYLNKVDQVNPQLNAVVQRLDPEIGMQQAKHADEQLASGKPVGRLHGLPMTIKDHIKVKNFVVTRGSLAFKDYRCDCDAPIVAKLKNEGAIVIGITNMPELGPAFETDNDVYGLTKNPYDLSKTPGGSSGGEAAIIASGGSTLGIGTDGGGSVRLPAHFSGIAGIKPTQHLVSCVGNVPADGGIGMVFYTPGPMARYIEDLRLVLPIISGPDGVDPHVMPLNLPMKTKPLNEMRIGYLVNSSQTTADRDTQATMKNAIDALKGNVAEVTEVDFLDIDYIGQFHWETFFYGGDQAKGFMKILQNEGLKKFSPTLQRFFDGAAQSELFDAGELRRRFFEADQIRMQTLQHMQHFDAIILPACATPAKPFGTTQANMMDFNYTMAFNLLGWPGSVVRCGTSEEGLPIGLQVVAKPWGDYTTLAVAEYLEKSLGGWKMPTLNQ